jgi:hypothetical protein
MAIGLFAVVSIALTIASPWGMRTDAALQVGLIAVLAFVLVGLNLARSSARAGVEAIPDGTPKPGELSAQLRACEERFASDSSEGTRRLSKALKALRESVQYSISSAGRVAASDTYKDFAKDVEKLASELFSISLPLTEVDALSARIQALQVRAGLVSSGLKRHSS